MGLLLFHLTDEKAEAQWLGKSAKVTQLVKGQSQDKNPESTLLTASK